MKRQDYFPKAVTARPEWFTNFADELPGANAILALAAASVTDIVKDARYCAYASGDWLTKTREFGPAATASLQDLYYGSSVGDKELVTFTAPALGVAVPVPAGALTRIFAFVQTIKAAPAYSQDIGLLLGIVGAEDTTEHPVPTFSVSVEHGGGSCECVKITFRKYGRDGVVIYSRRGGSLEWEMLAIDTASPYLDHRPLLVAGTPEVREYRLQFYDDSAPSGGYTDPTSVTVSP